MTDLFERARKAYERVVQENQVRARGFLLDKLGVFVGPEEQVIANNARAFEVVIEGRKLRVCLPDCSMDEPYFRLETARCSKCGCSQFAEGSHFTDLVGLSEVLHRFPTIHVKLCMPCGIEAG